MKKKIAWIVLWTLVVSLWPATSPFSAFALDVGGTSTVTNVRFVKQHVGYDVTGGNVIIIGTNLTGVNVLFEVSGGIPKKIGTLNNDSNAFFLNYVFNFEEADSFTGRIYIGNKIVDLNTPNFPNITSGDNAFVNQDQPGLEGVLKVNGSNLNLINNTDITATYGRGILQNRILDTLEPPGQTASSITFRPRAPGPLGFQDITISQSKVATATAPIVDVTYYYQNAFRILENLNVDPVVVYPNAASRGDFITLSSPNFSDVKNYRVYFLNQTDNDFAFTDAKMSPSVILSEDKQRLSVQVPTSLLNTLGTKRIVIVDVVNNEIISRYNIPEAFNLIDAVFKPTITRINPQKGSDEGADIQLIGRNLITPNIPELIAASGGIVVQNALPSNANQVMTINFSITGVTFKDLPVTSLTRQVRAYVSKQAFFEVVGGQVRYSKVGADDYLYIRTDIIDDAAIDPFKDVILEFDTLIVAGGQTFTFSQSVIVRDGFEFVPSSIEPIITSITPDKVHITQALNPKENTLLSIAGNNFLVNKYTDSSGIIRTNYPVVLLQVTDTLGADSFIVKFNKNDTTGTPQGTIYDKDGIVVGVGVDLVVLNAQNQIVDGSVGNEIGTRIVLYLPKEVDFAVGGKKNLQVINPKRGSNDLGIGRVVLDFIDLVQATDTPVIESVVPNIVTADSRADIVITGSNFQNGVKVFIDGIDVGAVVRSIDPQGNSMTLSFKAPVGRITKTQIQVLNPLGGLATREFFYVSSFDQDPKITAVSPNLGTVDTLVVVSGDNFFKPDPAAETTSGLDGFRLLGTRVYLDGKDVNNYQLNSFGEINFIPYESPANTFNIFTNQAGRIKISPFYVNTLVTSSDDSVVYQWAFDADGNPQLFDGNAIVYTFRYSQLEGYQGFGPTGALIGPLTITPTQLSMNGTTLNVRMDNRIIRASYTLNKELYAEPANYWNSILLKDFITGDLYTLTKQPDGSIRLSNGQFNVFTLKTQGSDIANPDFRAVDASNNSFGVSVTSTRLTVNTATPLQLDLLTPYLFDMTTREITGNRVRVDTKNKLVFSVPNLVSSTGLKDVRVVNPDTRSATLIRGFYYYQLPATQPTIASITPNRGSVEGGYIVTIRGKDYRPTTRVYFDGLLVPAADTVVNLAGTEIQVKVPRYTLDLAQVFGVGELKVPVVLVNTDGGSAQLQEGFTYVKPASAPKISQLILNRGTTNGGEVVEIIGEDFRFFEPYINLGGGPGYDVGIDTFTNLNSYLPVSVKWDNLLANRFDNGVDLWEQTPMPGGASFYGYDYYYASNILPRVYFGTVQAKIVEFDNGYIKVITPPNAAGAKSVVVMNNDSGVSNALPYTFESSNPRITFINPNQGARIGGERREIVGSGFASSSFKAYQNDLANTIVTVSDKVQTLVRFGNLTNTTIAVGQPNDGRINANRATVNLAGGLRVSYDGNANALDVSIEEGGLIYSRNFTNYTGGDVFVPAGMLKNGINYYQPVGFGYATPTVFNTATDYEWIRISVDPISKRLFVSRGFAPRVDFETSGKLSLTTPSYYTVELVQLYVYNPDGGIASSSFRFTNPASRPIIQMVNPFEPIPANSVENNTATEQRMVQASISGGVEIEIKGRDFRDGAKVFLGTKPAQVLDIVKDEINNLDVIIARVPAAQATDIGVKLPIIVENTDGGIANSADIDKLGTDKRLIYFIYRKPLSLPTIGAVVPNKTSQFGGNTVEIRGTDFRQGAMVIIGSIGGVPVIPFAIENVGRFIRFIVPSTLTPGNKSIQVINTDFGTVTFNNGLQVISYPIVNNEIRTVDDSKVVNVVLTEGGEKIKLTGSNFQSGAKVVFGGTRVLQVPGQTGEIGFYKDDRTYVVQGGVLSPNVQFVDANTLIVTTPEVFEEKEFTLTVINPDTGLSDSNAKVRYSVPVPSAPTTLKVAIVDNQYIRLYDYRTERVKYFEVYTYLGPKTVTQLTANNYRDFRSLGTTTLEPYKISRLDGFNKLTSADRIYFALKAVNEYGSSTWSNIVFLQHTQFKDVKALGDPGLTGSLLPSLEQVAVSDYTAGELTVLFTDQGFRSNIAVNLTGDAFKGLLRTKVIMPDTMVKGNFSRMTMASELLNMSYIPYGFNNATFRANDTASTEYVTWVSSWQQTSLTSSALSQLPSTVRAVSPVVTMTYDIANNTGSRSLGTLSVPVDVAFNLNAQAITVKTGVYTIYFYDLSSRTWRTLASNYDSSKGQVNYQALNPGYYVLTVRR